MTETGPLCPRTSIERGVNGAGSPVLCANRGQTPEPLGVFTWWRCSLCCSLGPSYGLHTPHSVGGVDWGVYLPPPHQYDTVNFHKADIQHYVSRRVEAGVPGNHALVGTEGDKIWK